MKKTILLISLSISILAFSQEEFLSITAPLNPDFVKYLEDKDKDQYGLIPSPTVYSFEGVQQLRSETPLPDKLDLREEVGFNSLPRLTTPRAQGSVNTCWGFTTMDAIQSIWSKNFATEDYSVENLVNCHGFIPDKDDGGTGSMATAYLTRFAGPVFESADPYISSESGICNPITDADKVALVSQAISLPKGNNELTKQMIYNHGGVFTAVSSACFNTSYYNTTYNAAYIPITDQTSIPNHAGTIIGWDDNFDKTKFNPANQPQNNGAWIVKNTYGTEKNEGGYYYLSYEDKIVGTEATVFSERIEKTQVDTVYYYDKLGATSYTGNGSNTSCEALIKYTSSTPQKITGVGTYASSASSTIDIEVYKIKYGNDLYGLLGSSTGNICNLPGYYTFTFDNPVGVNGDFYIKIKYQTTSIYPLPIEKANSIANPELLPTGYQWGRYSSLSGWGSIGSPNFDLCIKVYAQNCNASLCAINDDIENALMLSLETTEGPFSNVCATAQPNEPHPLDIGCTSQNGWCEDEDKIDNSLWFTFVAPASGSVKIVTSGFDNQIAVYDATFTGTYADIISDDPSKYNILAANDDVSDNEPAATINLLENLTPGKTYWLQMDGSFGGVTGSATITITEENPTKKPEIKSTPISINNPVRDGLLHIQSSSPIFEITLWNLIGNIYKNFSFNGETEIKVPVINLITGYYLAKIKTENGIETRKIIIVK